MYCDIFVWTKNVLTLFVVLVVIKKKLAVMIA